MKHPLCTLLVACAAMLPPGQASAQLLPPPPLRPDEIVVNTVTGCAVVGVWSEVDEQRGGRTLVALKDDLSRLHLDKTCRPGELLMGHFGRVSEFLGKTPPDGIWHYFGRSFGVTEPTERFPSISVVWERSSARIPVGVDTIDAFEQRLKKDSFSVIFTEGPRTEEVFVSYHGDDYALPREKRRYRLTVRDGLRFHYPACPPPENPRSCFPVWQQHAGPVLKRAQEFLAESRPKIEALREAVSAHLRAADRSP
jgi:hypothetical protein